MKTLIQPREPIRDIIWHFIQRFLRIARQHIEILNPRGCIVRFFRDCPQYLSAMRLRRRVEHSHMRKIITDAL